MKGGWNVCGVCECVWATKEHREEGGISSTSILTTTEENF